MKRLIVAAVLLLAARFAAAIEIDFGEKTFTSGIPEGWQEAVSLRSGNNLSIVNPLTRAGKKVLTANLFNADPNATRIVYQTEPIESVACDNISANIILYRDKNTSYQTIDKVGLVVSTNDFESCIEIDKLKDLQEYPCQTAGWVTNKYCAYVEGLSASKVKIGIKFLATGASHQYGYVGGLDVKFVASATPSEVQFVTDGGSGGYVEKKTLLPKDENVRIRAKVDALPAGEITSTNVYASVTRNGVETPYVLSPVGETEYVSAPLPVFDAGEEISVSVHTEYTSKSLPTLGDQIGGIAYEYAEPICRTVGKKGSVWINEAILSDSGLTIEFAGTVNRAMTSGWVVSNATTSASKPIGGEFDFKANMVNGVVGLEVRTFGGDLVAEGTNVLQLINACGVCESAVEVVKVGEAFNYCMAGIAVWNEKEGFDYDWTGTGTDDCSDGVFKWRESESPTPGRVNDGQGFKVPISTWVSVRTMTDAGAPLPYAAVTLNVSNIANVATMSVTTTNVQTSADGTVDVLIKGCSSNTNEAFTTVSATAFGWCADEISQVIKFTAESNDLQVKMSRAIAVDDCDSNKPFWEQTTATKWTVLTQGNRKFLNINLYNAFPGTNSIMSCKNSLSAGGKRCVAVSFDFKNTIETGRMNAYNELCVEFSTNATWRGTVFDAVVLSNKRSEYGNGAWYTYKDVVELPDGFESSELSLRILCRTKNDVSHTLMYLDNFYIAFQDVAMPTNFARTSVAVPVSGESTGFELDVLPQTNGTVAGVSADLHLVLNNVTNVIPFAFLDDVYENPYTNSLTHVDGEIMPAHLGISSDELVKALGWPFLTGDQVTYYAVVHYDSDNGDTNTLKRYEARYAPDDSRMEGNHWIFEGNEYGVSTNLEANTFFVTGDALSCVGTPEVTTEGVKFAVHGYSKDKISSFTINVNGVDYHPFEGLDTNAQVRVTGEFELPTGLEASKEYTVTLSAEDANGPMTPATFTFVTRPAKPTAEILGIATNIVQLTAHGNEAGGYKVLSGGWTQTGANTWTRSDGTPNVPFSATICATNKVGIESEPADILPGYTLAAAATKAPVIEKEVVTVVVGADGDYSEAVDGNPEGTEYAVLVKTNDAVSAYVSTNGVAVWKTLGAWQQEPVTVGTPILNLATTNAFSFVTRNFDGLETVNDSPATNCTFEMTAEITKVEQKADPFGTVEITLGFFDPAMSQNANAEVQYKLEGQSNWSSLASVDVAFDDLEAVKTISWNAWAAIGKNVTTNYTLQVKLSAGARATDWVELRAPATLDFVRPTTELLRVSPAYISKGSMELTVKFSEPVTGFSAASLSVSNGRNVTVNGSGASYTVSIVPQAEGTVSVQVPDGKVSDAFGNKNTASVQQSCVYDATKPVFKPTDHPIAGAPDEGVVTNGTDFAFTVLAEDATAVAYHWTTNGVAVAGYVTAELSGTAREGTNTVSVFAVDAAGNACDPVSRTWVVDTIAPTAPVIDGKPAALTNKAGFSMTATSEDATAITYHWTFSGAKSTGVALSGTAKEGANAVSVYATDEAGNKSKEVTYTWTLDTTKPVIHPIAGAPDEGVVTNGTDFAFTVSADDASSVAYHWTTNGVTVAGNLTAALSGTAREGTNTVSVFAVDATGNACNPVSRTWVVDTIAPTAPVIEGKPASLTNKAGFSMTAASEDATAITYHWTFNGAESTGATLAGTARESANVVSVYATDEAGNKSKEVTYTWTLDTTKPVIHPIAGTPEEGVVTNGTDFAFTVSADDASSVAYHWTTNGVAVAGNLTAALSGTAREGTNTVSVFAVDAAGNACNSVSRTWVVDTIAPTDPEINGEPAKLTNEADFSMTAVSEDATAITYHWTFNGETSEGPSLYGTAQEGANSASVYVTDEAGNSSSTNTVTWTLDTTPPTVELSSATPERFNAAAAPMVVTAQFSEAVADFTAASVSVENGTVKSVTPSEKSANAYVIEITPTDDGDVSVTIDEGAVTDLAGNSNEASTTLTRVYDNVNPTVELSSTTANPFGASAAPLVVTVTFSKEVTNFTADSVTVVNGTVESVTASETIDNAYVVNVDPTEDGEVVVSVAAGAVTDLAGNPNEASAELKRTYDTTAPTSPVISGTPGNGVTTNDRTVNLTASSTDATSSIAPLTYHWTFNGVSSSGTSLVGTSSQGANSVSVYAEDAAGNKSEPTVWNWTLDTTPPTVEISSATPEWFNEAAAPMVVAVQFSEPVTNFTAASVTVVNGSVSEVTGTGAQYTVKVNPTADGDVSVSIAAGVVADLAGNPNTASKTITRKYDAENPTVLLTSEAPARLGKSMTLEVTVTFSETVTDFDGSKVTVVNGTVSQVTGSGATYQVTVTPRDLKEGEEEQIEVSVQIAAGVVTDRAGNANEASAKLTRIYDPLALTVGISSKTPTHFNEASAPLVALVEFSKAVQAFNSSMISVENGNVTSVSVAPGNNTYAVTVSPTSEGAVVVQVPAGVVSDVAGNKNEEASAPLTRIYDTTAPTVELASETPEWFNAEKAPMVVSVQFSEAVTNFTADSVTVVNGTVSSVTDLPDVENAYVVEVEPIEDGEVSVSVAAGVVADLAGNPSLASDVLTRTYDTVKPTVTLTSETPEFFNSTFVVLTKFSEPVTNYTAGSAFTADSVSVINGRVTDVTKSPTVENAYLVTVEPNAEGEVSVSVEAGVVTDRAGNPNEASDGAQKRTYDHTPPTVTLSSDTPDPFHTNDVFAVKVVFSEPVTNFTADSITVVNGSVAKVEEVVGEDNTYLATINWRDLDVTNMAVRVEAGAVADRAGNTNVDPSNEIKRECRLKNPWVTLTCEKPDIVSSGSSWKIVVTFSTKMSTTLTYTNFEWSAGCYVSSSKSAITKKSTSDGYDVYEVTVTKDTNKGLPQYRTQTIQIKQDALKDKSGLGNEPSNVLKLVVDGAAPTNPRISGDPAAGSETHEKAFRLFATADDEGTLTKFEWTVNGHAVTINGTNEINSVGREAWIVEGENWATVKITDMTAHASGTSARYTWTYNSSVPSQDVEFGGDICIKVDPTTGATGVVRFVSADFKPGATSSFTLNGFSASTQHLGDFQMWFVVSEALKGVKRHVKVNETATFDSKTGELTVTLPPEALKKNDEAYDSLFIFGVDNENPVQ